MNNRINEDLIEEIRSSNDIVDVISEYIKVDKKGKDYFGLCPFHKEKTPSFSIVPSKQIFYCFGCGKGGNVISFIKEIENLDFLEAVKFLAERVKIAIPEGDDPVELEKEKEKRRLYNINKTAARIFYNNLAGEKGKVPRDYLKNRNIEGSIITSFGMGYSENDYESLIKELEEEGFKKEEIYKVGLALKSKDGRFYSRFRGRLMFPIIDLRGNVIGFGGRVIGKDDGPKYMNSPQSPIYNKSRSLYGLNIAKKNLSGTLIIVEGYMDVVSLHMHGFSNTIATLGTAMTIEHARIIKKYADEVIIAYDMDQAGRNATLRGIDLLEQVGCKIKILEIPDGKDPDEFIRKKGKNAFSEVLQKAKTFVEFKIMLLKDSIDDTKPEERVKFIRGAAKLLSLLKSRVEREIFAKKIAKEYSISEDTILAEINSNLVKETGQLKRSGIKADLKANEEGNEGSNIIKVEMYILMLLGLNYRLFEKAEGRIDFKTFSEELKPLYEKVIKIISEKRHYTPGELLTIVPESAANEFAKTINTLTEEEGILKSFTKALNERELLKAEKGLNDITKKLSDENLSTEEKEKLKKRYLEYKGILKERKK